MNLPRDFHWGAPEYGLLVLVMIPLAWLLFENTRWRRMILPQWGAASLSQSYRIGLYSLFFAGYVFLAAALAWPLGNEHDASSSYMVPARPDLILVLDTSQSMGVKDMGGRSRLEFAKEMIDQLLASSLDAEVALWVFNSDLYPLVPFTFDRTFARIFSRNISLNEGGTYGTDFLALSREGEKELSLHRKGGKIALLFSDGEDTSMGPDKESALSFKGWNMPIYTVGLGSEKGGVVPDVLREGKEVISIPDKKRLAIISKETGGRYLETVGKTAQSAGAALAAAIPSTNPVERGENEFETYFQIPLGIALLLWAYYFLRQKPLLFFSGFCLFFIPLEGSDKGEALFASGNYKEAEEWYLKELRTGGPQWRLDKIYYGLGCVLQAKQENEEALFTYAFISPEAFTFPLFRARIENNLSLLLNEPLDPLSIQFWSQWRKGHEEALITALKQFSHASDPLQGLSAALCALACISSLETTKAFPEFFRIIRQSQERNFFEGKCQCNPWDEVIPLYEDGLQMVRGGVESMRIASTYLLWKKAYTLLKHPPPSKTPLSEEREQTWSALELMNQKDKPSQEKIPAGGEIPW